jgi:hypothetical protein
MGVVPTSFSSFWDASVAAMVQQHTAAVATPNNVADARSGPSSPGLVVAQPRHDAGETKDASL